MGVVIAALQDFERDKIAEDDFPASISVVSLAVAGDLWR